MKQIQEYLDFVQSVVTPDQLAVESGKFIEEKLGQRQFVILKHHFHPRPFSVIYNKYPGFFLDNWMRSFIDFKAKITPFNPQPFHKDYLYFLTDRYYKDPDYLLVAKNKFSDKTSEVLAAWQRINSILNAATREVKSELSVERGNLISQLTHDIQSIITLCEEIKKTPAVANRLKYQEKVNSNILFISREAELLRTQLNLADLIGAALELINIDRKDILLTISGNISDIEVDVELFARAFNEIVKNAIDAVGGKLSDIMVTVDALPSASPFQPEGWIVIKVMDNGPGITESFIPLVTDAFFTTAKLEGSTGFGLTIAQKIINAHSGHLEVQSGQNKGTTVLIFLPQIRDE